MAGRFDEALPLLRAAEPWVQTNADSMEAAEFEGNLAAVLDNLGRPAEAETHHHREIEFARARGNHSSLATARANLAVNRLDAGDVGAAREQLAMAQQLVSSFELKGGSAGFIAALQAQTARASGQYAAALNWCDEAEALTAAASPLRLPVVYMHRAQTLLDLGQPARAQQNLARCDLGTMPARLRARHGLLTGRLRLALQQDARSAFDAALANAPDPGWPELRLTLRIERAEALDAGPACAELQAVIDLALSLGLVGVSLAARLRLARRAPDPALALAAGEAALATPAAIEPNGLYRAERWLGPVCALGAAGQAERARALAHEAWAWVQGCTGQLPESWRDAFLHRQSVNQALQAHLR
jgi:tetratricopeptide (TPR) repeat protein